MLGLVQEHGPYVMDNGGNSFHSNDYSWNKEANMLYIEAPAGVGYSYCIDQRDCEKFDDNNSAEDNLNALLYFFEYKFPERKKNDLYISGESYAGIYVPYLVNQLDAFNTKWAGNPNVFKPNLKGFMVGNGVTNWQFDTMNAYIEMAYWHGIYSDSMWDDI
jgi:serine carboxypeptidase-like clade 2